MHLLTTTACSHHGLLARTHVHVPQSERDPKRRMQLEHELFLKSQTEKLEEESTTDDVPETPPPAKAQAPTTATATATASGGYRPAMAPKPQSPALARKPQSPALARKPQSPALAPKSQSPALAPKPKLVGQSPQTPQTQAVTATQIRRADSDPRADSTESPRSDWRTSTSSLTDSVLSPTSASKRRESALAAVTHAAPPPVPRGFASIGRASGSSSTDHPTTGSNEPTNEVPITPTAAIVVMQRIGSKRFLFASS
jgi:hypothetical protein